MLSVSLNLFWILCLLQVQQYHFWYFHKICLGKYLLIFVFLLFIYLYMFGWISISLTYYPLIDVLIYINNFYLIHVLCSWSFSKHAIYIFALQWCLLLNIFYLCDYFKNNFGHTYLWFTIVVVTWYNFIPYYIV